MEKTAFEALVRRALLDANYHEYEQISAQADAIAYAPSPRYLAWEKKFLSAPFAFAKKRARPVWQRFLRAAACFLLVAAVAFGGLMATSPEARAWVQQVFALQFPVYTRFLFSGAAGTETGAWQTTYLPEGFGLVEEKAVGATTKAIYKGTDGSLLHFFYAPAEGASFGVDSEHQRTEKIDLNGTQATLLRAALPGETSYIIWMDAGSSTAFELSSTVDADELVMVAKGVQRVP